MFGGLAFLIGGNMAAAASGQGGVLVRVDPAQSDTLVTTTNARPMEMRGRPMQGWLRVDAEDVRTKRQLAKTDRSHCRCPASRRVSSNVCLRPPPSVSVTRTCELPRGTTSTPATVLMPRRLRPRNPVPLPRSADRTQRGCRGSRPGAGVRVAVRRFHPRACRVQRSLRAIESTRAQASGLARVGVASSIASDGDDLPSERARLLPHKSRCALLRGLGSLARSGSRPLLLLGAALDAAAVTHPYARPDLVLPALDPLARPPPTLATALREKLHRLAAARAGARLGGRGHGVRIPSQSPPAPCLGGQLTAESRVESLSKAHLFPSDGPLRKRPWGTCSVRCPHLELVLQIRRNKPPSAGMGATAASFPASRSRRPRQFSPRSPYCLGFGSVERARSQTCSNGVGSSGRGGR